MIVEQFGLSRDPPTVTKSTNGGALARVEEKEKVQKTDIGTTNDYCLDEKDSGCEDVSRRGRRWMPNIWEGWRRGSA